MHAAPLAHAQLVEASERAEPEVLEGLARLAAAGVTREEVHDGDVAYALSHALLAEAAGDRLPTVVRQRLHLRLADTLTASGRTAPEAVARHLRGAGRSSPPAASWRRCRRRPSSRRGAGTMPRRQSTWASRSRASLTQTPGCDCGGQTR